MRIGFVTQWFPPEPGTMVPAGIADGLASRGHEVHVLTGFPNYPTGKLQDGYSLRPYRRDLRSDRVTVHRAPLYPSHDRGAVKRAANYLSFAISAAFVARHKMPRPDVWLIYSSPATAAIPALLSKRPSAPILLLIQDLWPDSVADSGFVAGGRKMSGIERALNRYCDWSYSRASAIGVISPAMRKILKDRGVNEAKIHFLPNGIDDSFIPHKTTPSEQLRRQLGLPAGRIFMYAGNIGELQQLDSLVRAFAACPDATLVLIGDGVALQRLRLLVHSRRITNVHFMRPQPSDMIGQYLSAADIHVVSLRDTPLLRATMPSKVQVAFATGRPLLVHAAGDVVDLVRDTHTGLVAPPNDINQAEQAITEFVGMSNIDLHAMGCRSRLLYESEYSPSVATSRIESALTAVVST